MTPRRTGTYLTFHAGGTPNPSQSDRRYFELLKAWSSRAGHDFHFVDSHEKTSAVRDSSKRETLRSALVYRLLRSKNMILIATPSTPNDTDWVPFEIAYAVDNRIPIIVAYPGYDWLLEPNNELRACWPAALALRVANNTARTFHIPFKQQPLNEAVHQFDVSNPPSYSVWWYKYELYQSWGLAP